MRGPIGNGYYPLDSFKMLNAVAGRLAKEATEREEFLNELREVRMSFSLATQIIQFSDRLANGQRASRP